MVLVWFGAGEQEIGGRDGLILTVFLKEHRQRAIQASLSPATSSLTT
jgi:hypothetical protein